MIIENHITNILKRLGLRKIKRRPDRSVGIFASNEMLVIVPDFQYDNFGVMANFKLAIECPKDISNEDLGNVLRTAISNWEFKPTFVPSKRYTELARKFREQFFPKFLGDTSFLNNVKIISIKELEGEVAFFPTARGDYLSDKPKWSIPMSNSEMLGRALRNSIDITTTRPAAK